MNVSDRFSPEIYGKIFVLATQVKEKIYLNPETVLLVSVCETKCFFKGKTHTLNERKRY